MRLTYNISVLREEISLKLALKQFNRSAHFYVIGEAVPELGGDSAECYVPCLSYRPWDSEGFEGLA